MLGERFWKYLELRAVLKERKKTVLLKILETSVDLVFVC